ncbi:unnamed protein product [Musa textilis]
MRVMAFVGGEKLMGKRAKAYGMTAVIILRGTQSVVSWRLVSSTCVHGLIPCSSSGFVWWPTDMAEEPLGGHLNSTHAMRSVLLSLVDKDWTLACGDKGGVPLPRTCFLAGQNLKVKIFMASPTTSTLCSTISLYAPLGEPWL